MRFGSDPKFLKLLRRRQSRGHKVEALENIPELYLDLQFAWSAFGELSGCRTFGFGHPNPIQLSEVRSWLDLNVITDLEDRRELTLLILAMDKHYLAYASEKAEGKRKTKKPKSDT